ncbi:uncharacterized protein LOC111075874 [Drosophila obscura]|uniref:uncharacterized protein LOC111075874 n=1 Tax=Drosophila obscura TaxID=7282 RepID=UPI001BB15AE5|nr:uncharacterized protein LOC111075874 [Drosophila obscura]
MEELEQSQEGTKIQTETNTIHGPNVHSHVLGLAALARFSSVRSTGSGFHIDGQAILSPLLTQTKRSDMQVSKQMAFQLENKFEKDRVPAGQERSGHGYTSVARRRGLPQLQHSKTDIFEQPPRTKKLSPGPQSLGLKMANAKNAGGYAVQLLQSLTLEKPSQVLVQRKADAEAREQAHIQPEIVGSKAKGYSPKHQERLVQPSLEQEIDLMIERTLNEHVNGLRNYLRSHRDRFIQLLQSQYDERLRMQQEFDRQQKLLIQQICAETDLATRSGAT